jgi:hypothetical protein
VQAFWVCEKKKKGILASIMLNARDILDSNVLLCPYGEDIAYVTSINHTPKVWTIHSSSSEWPQCDCSLVEQGVDYKHVMEVLKMLHPNIHDGAIVGDTGTFHGVNKGSPTIGHMVCDDLTNQQSDIDPKNEDVGILDMKTSITQVKYADLGELIDQAFHDIKTTTIEILMLQLHVLRGKQQDMIVKGIVGLEHLDINLLFPSALGDNTFRWHREILEPHVQKKNHLKDIATRHMRIKMPRESKIPNVGMDM